MERQGFGKRGVTLNGERVIPSPRRAESHRDGSPRSVGSPAIRWAFVVAVPLALLLGWGWIELRTANTSLITPINGNLIFAVRLCGLALGIVAAFLLKPLITLFASTVRAWFWLLMIPAIGVVMVEGLTWRIANWIEFGGSDAPFVAASYPIESIARTGGHGGRRTFDTFDIVRIDPFHTREALDLPIRHSQFTALDGAAQGTCVTVMQRKSSSGAIQVRIDEGQDDGGPLMRQTGPCDGQPRHSGPWN